MKYSKSNLIKSTSRKRLMPKDRKEQLLAFYIGLVVGDVAVTTNHPCYLTIGHTEIAEAAGVSIASVFNYFNTAEDLQGELEQWALDNINNIDDCESYSAAQHIFKQYAAIFPHLAAGLDLTVVIMGFDKAA